MTKNKFLIFILVVVILTSCFVIIEIVHSFASGGASCKINPLVYGAEDLYENNGEEFVCGCYPLDYPGSKYRRFYFDKEGLYAENPDSNLILP